MRRCSNGRGSFWRGTHLHSSSHASAASSSSHTYALADMQLRIEPQVDVHGMQARKLPPAEREARQKEQEKRLAGVMFTPETIPSHHLVDLCVEMAETGILSYLKPESCTSRAQEMQQIKKDTRLQLTTDGTIKVSKTKTEVQCPVATELELRAAYTRRSLALDLAGVASFMNLERWVHHLFVALQRPQPAGFIRVSVAQLIECDKQLFIRASHALLAKLSADDRGEKPFNAYIDKALRDPELQQYIQPLPGRPSGPPVTGTEHRQGKRKRGRSANPAPPSSGPQHPEARAPHLHSFRSPSNCHLAASRRCLMGSRSASPTTEASASTRAPANVVLEATMCATRRAASERSPSSSVRTRTDSHWSRVSPSRRATGAARWPSNYVQGRPPYLVLSSMLDVKS